MNEVLRYHYELHWPASYIDRWFDFPKGTAVKVIVNDWLDGKVFGSRMMRHG